MAAIAVLNYVFQPITGYASNKWAPLKKREQL